MVHAKLKGADFHGTALKMSVISRSERKRMKAFRGTAKNYEKIFWR